MLHETSQCFMTHSRDFCYVSKERVEVSEILDCLQPSGKNTITNRRCAMGRARAESPLDDSG